MSETQGSREPVNADGSSKLPRSNHDRLPSIDARPLTVARQQPAHHHQRALTEDHSRPSLVKLRSRSNTSVSTNGAIAARKGSCPDASPEASRSADRPRSLHNKADKSDHFRRKLKTKSSKIFKRPDSSDDLTSLAPLDWSNEFEDICPKVVQESPISPPSKPSRKSLKSHDPIHRYNISEPFNFQHLTHTEPIQFLKMQEANHNDFISEFSAIRASQAPRRQLQGIKADALPSRDGSHAQDLASNPPSPTYPVRRQSMGATLHSSRDKLQHGLHSTPTSSDYPHFSRPVPMPATALISDSSSAEFLSTPEDSPLGGEFDAHAVAEPFPPYDEQYGCASEDALDYPIATWSDGAYNFEIPHAVTTPDDGAETPQLPPYRRTRSELTQVLEEDETSDLRHSMAGSSIPRITTPHPGLRSSKSFPGGQSPPTTRPPMPLLPNITAAHGDSLRPPSVFPQSPNDVPYRPRSFEPPVNNHGAADVSWEDDIDWCYENEAEADCNFDWYRSSALKKASMALAAAASPQPTNQFTFQRPNALLENVMRSPPTRIPHRSSSIYSESPHLIMPVQTYVPELDPPSAVSAQSSLDSISEAVTPTRTSEVDAHKHFLTAECKPACQDWAEHSPASARHSDPEATLIYEDSYHLIYARKSLPEQSFKDLHDHKATGGSMSTRSSHLPLSTSGSEESFWSRYDQRTYSGESVPDLVHSRISGEGKDASSNFAIDQSSLPEPSGNVSEAGHAAVHRRRTASFAKEIAQKAMLPKIATPGILSDNEPLPIPPPLPSPTRPHSDTGIGSLDSWTMAPTVRPAYNRAHSGSAVSRNRPMAPPANPNPFPAHLSRDGIRV